MYFSLSFTASIVFLPNRPCSGLLNPFLPFPPERSSGWTAFRFPFARIARRESGSRSPSGLAGTAPLRRAFRFGFPRCSCCRFAACAWLRRASARRTCLCQAHATVPKTLLSTTLIEK